MNIILNNIYLLIKYLFYLIEFIKQMLHYLAQRYFLCVDLRSETKLICILLCFEDN